MLYIIKQSPYNRSLPAAGKDVHLLLIQDGVIAAALPDQALLNGYASISVLAEDLAARGLSVSNDKLSTIDYDRFVSLTLEHSPVVSW